MEGNRVGETGNFPHLPLTTLIILTLLSPDSDQHQFSPNDIHTLSRD